MPETITSQSKVSVIPWGTIDGPDERKWGLKVGSAYVARGGAPLFFDTRKEAVAEAKKLRDRLRASKSESPDV